MKMEGSIHIWREGDGTLSIYSTNRDEEGALGYRQSNRCAALLFEITALRLQQEWEGGK